MKSSGGLEVVQFSKEDWIFACSFAASSFLQAVVVTIEGPSYDDIFITNDTQIHHSYQNGTVDKQVATVDPVTGTVSMINPDSFDDKSDVSATFIGLLLSYYQLLSFILTPLIGGYVEEIGMKRVYMFGIYIAGITPFFSAILTVLRKSPNYLFYSFLIRGLQAVGGVGMQIAIYMMITVIFPAQVASIFAINQAMSVLGFVMGGPIVFFIEIMGGFAERKTSFIVLGVVYVTYAVVIRWILPNLPPREKLSTTTCDLFVRYIQFLRIYPIFFYIFSLVVTGIGATFLQSILMIFILDYKVGVFTATVIPLLPVLLQILSPIWGYVLDRLKFADMVALIGACVVTISLLFVGPAPFLPIQEGLGITCTGLVIFGLGQGALILASYVLMIQEATEHHIPDDMLTVTIISSTYVASMSLGGAIGPILSGIIYDSYGFRYATVFPFFLYAALAVFFVVDGLTNLQVPVSVENVEDFTLGKIPDEVKPLIRRRDK